MRASARLYLVSLLEAPDQVPIEMAACACRAAGLELGDGAEPGANSIADGFGLSKGLSARAS